MVNYNFESLSSFDFEVLTRDLLQKHFDIYLDNFKSGRDGGIDLRSSSSKDKTLVIQCKHYVHSTYAKLLSELKKESKKLASLNPEPNRYILVTSQGLTPKNKDDIKLIFNPYIQTSEDIFSKDNLNNLLGLYPEIERKHYKLWLASQNVMEKIMHSQIFSKSEIALENIKRRIKLYVQNKSFFTAKEILADLNYCIIAGAPGIGKTSLAEMLIVDYLANDYEIYKISNMDEAHKVYSVNRKQVFYYDDFLGQTSLELKLNNKEDDDILTFIDAVSRSKNVKFILTTREYILNQAKTTYEKLARSDFDIQRCTINLSDYTNVDKAKILYNHLYFSDLPQNLVDQLLQNKNYITIIKHKNYSPRIIEWMTIYYKQKDNKDYYDDFFNNLNNPLRIWEHAFNYQLSDAGRNILLILATLPEEVTLSDVEGALKSFETLLGKFSTLKDFQIALKELEGNFVKIKLIGSENVISFNNPSIKDFIESYLSANLLEFTYLCKSFVFFEQSVAMWNLDSKVNQMGYFVTKQLSEFMDSFKRNLTSKSISISYERWSRDREILKEKVSYVNRFIFLLNLSTILKNDEVIHTINQVEVNLYDAIGTSKEDRWKFILLLNEMVNLKYSSIIGTQKWISLFKDILFNDLSEIDSFDIITDLASKYPSEFHQSEMLQLRSAFNDFYINDVALYLAEEDNIDIEKYMNVLDNVSSFLNVNIDEAFGELEDKRRELYEAEGPGEPDFEDDHWREDSRDNYDESNVIDSLFDTLKEF